ncbi:MAG: hypothetical protein N3F62_00490 [Bacteroidia bacterium]|nr:hypothetical protein [Bacteroidia bacterium]
MKKYLLVFILYCLYFQNVIAQQNHFLINTPQSGNITNVACKSIKLGPGYKYTAQSGQSMRTYIDPNMLCDISYGGGYTSTTTTIPPLNTSSEVGSIPGSFAVGSSGAAIYNVPLNLPPGTNGIMPQLSIVYNSQGGDGWLGQGWQLTGFSAITRTFKNVYLDGRAGGIDFTNGDAFALDGQRLFALIGQNGGDGTQYGTEVENFSSIKSYGNILANPVYWQVKTKEGTIMEYGNTTDSYIEAGNNLVAWMWLLNKVQDVNANYYSIHYIENKNGDTIEYRPDYIEYTGNTNTGLAPYVKIKFIYNKRSDVTYNIIHKGSLNYKTPVILKNSVLLTEIQVLVNNVLQKRYELNYFLSPIGNSRLYEIKEQGSDGKYLNSTKFVWSPIMNKNTIEYMSFSSNSNDYLGKHVSYDFNNDGYDDVAKIANNNIIIFNNPKNGQSFNVNNYIPFPRDTLNNTITFSSKLQERGDFDGDGKEDLLIIEMGTNHRVWLLSGLQIKGPYTITNLNQTTNFLPLKYVVGDFDGNGTKEVFFFVIQTIPNVK